VIVDHAPAGYGGVEATAAEKINPGNSIISQDNPIINTLGVFTLRN
jgi:hypothetical protein